MSGLFREDKFTRYLLVRREYDDKSQFLALGGYTVDNYKVLVEDIIIMTMENEAFEERSDDYGTFYRVSGKLPGFHGLSLHVSIIWLQRKIDGYFQFITLIPERRQ